MLISSKNTLTETSRMFDYMAGHHGSAKWTHKITNHKKLDKNLKIYTWIHSSAFKRQAEDIPHSLTGRVHLCTRYYFYWQYFVMKCTESN